MLSTYNQNTRKHIPKGELYFGSLSLTPINTKYDLDIDKLEIQMTMRECNNHYFLGTRGITNVIFAKLRLH